MIQSVNSSCVSNECLGVVLAGGLSSRMGQDKSQLLRENESMLDFSKQTLYNSGIKNIVVSGDNYDVPDKVKKHGPVGGILSVLSMYPQVKSLLILPVDLPFITAKSLANLRLKGELSQKATYFVDHNIPLYLPNNTYLELFLGQIFQGNALTDKKGPSIRSLLKQVPHQAIKNNDANILFNANTPEQWQQAKQRLNN
jgi:molybdopterin-guanine dinucleotide biosynthesis protein A